jgi:hypothetical protein
MTEVISIALLSICLVLILIGFYAAFFKKGNFAFIPDASVWERPLTPMSDKSEAILSLLQSQQEAITALPNKTLQSIQGSANNATGKLGELVQLIKLKDTYDRLIPLNSVSDFMGIKFPTDTDPGCIHFIEVKSNKATLTLDQKKFKALLDTQNLEIVFKTVKVEIN